MEIRWIVEDGYAGDRGQYTNITKSELDDYETLEMKREFIYDCIEEDFKQNISWSLSCDIDALLKELK